MTIHSMTLHKLSYYQKLYLNHQENNALVTRNKSKSSKKLHIFEIFWTKNKVKLSLDA